MLLYDHMATHGGRPMSMHHLRWLSYVRHNLFCIHVPVLPARTRMQGWPSQKRADGTTGEWRRTRMEGISGVRFTCTGRVVPRSFAGSEAEAHGVQLGDHEQRVTPPSWRQHAPPRRTMPCACVRPPQSMNAACCPAIKKQAAQLCFCNTAKPSPPTLYCCSCVHMARPGSMQGW